MARRSTTLTVKVHCKCCGIYMFDSDQPEDVMCSYCREREIEKTREDREEMLRRKKAEDDDPANWHVRPREHPDSKQY